MKQLKNLAQWLIIAVAILIPTIQSYGVTPEEMEQARAVAASVFIRYENDGSGYLDGQKFKSMSEVSDAVKSHPTDQKLLQQFMQVPVANDFDTWDKDRLVEYWSHDFFKNSSLSTRNASMRNARIKARIRTMEVTAPKAVEAEEKAADSVKVREQAAESTSTPAPMVDSDTTTILDTEVEDGVVNESGDTNWTLIVLLIVLIAIVIALVVYGLKVLRGPQNNNISNKGSNKPEEDYAPQIVQNKANDNGVVDALRSQLAESRKSESDALDRLAVMTDRVRKLEQELSQLKQEKETLKSQKPASAVSQASTPVASSTRQIYLGRANQQRIFLRADRQFVAGKTIYRLVSGNELTGSFVVEDDPSVVEYVSLDPQTALAGACEVPTFAVGAFSKIVTDTPGTAIFEDGCWKVLRPAAVHLE